jgi:alkylhydroperoxidase family enzyme
MMSDREVWLKAWDVVRTHGALESAPVVATLLDVLGDDPHHAEWTRVAAAVDAINGGQLQ